MQGSLPVSRGPSAMRRARRRSEFADVGGMLAYGPNFSDNYHRAPHYVDRILKGAKPGDLPVERPTKLELVENAKSAQALNVALPTALLERADRIIR